MTKFTTNNDKPQDNLVERPLSKKEQKIYNSLKRALEDIKKWENGEIELKDAKDLLKEL